MFGLIGRNYFFKVRHDFLLWSVYTEHLLCGNIFSTSGNMAVSWTKAPFSWNSYFSELG